MIVPASSQNGLEKWLIKKQEHEDPATNDQEKGEGPRQNSTVLGSGCRRVLNFVPGLLDTQAYKPENDGEEKQS